MPYYDEHYDKAVGVFLLILTLIGDNYIENHTIIDILNNILVGYMIT